MMHTPREILVKARCLALKILRLRDDPKVKCHEFDDLVMEAQYIALDTKDLESLREHKMGQPAVPPSSPTDKE